MSYGAAVTRTHMHDWLILLLLLVITSILHVIHPFYRFVGKDMMTDLKYPLKSNTVPFWAVPIYSILLPAVIFIIVDFRRRDIYDLHHAILGLLYSVLLTNVITEAIKNAVGRPRPDFFWRCFPDGKDLYDQWGNVIRNGDKSVISGHIAKLCVIVLPLLVASLVGISRVDDYWHHWQVVFAGGLLGLVVATFCDLQFFPPPYNHQGCRPYAYLRVLEEEEMNANTQATNAANPLNAEAMEAHGVTEEVRCNERVALHLAHNCDSTNEDIEFGRR